MARRAIPDASSLDEANEILRGNWLQVIEQHHLQYSGNSMIRDILDIGCSVGVSTGYLADKFPSAKVTVSTNFNLDETYHIVVEMIFYGTIIFKFVILYMSLLSLSYVLMHLLQGLDLSPYFLAVAQFKEKKRSQRKNPIIWIHANGEDTGLLSNSFDLVSMAFVVCVVVYPVSVLSFYKYAWFVLVKLLVKQVELKALFTVCVISKVMYVFLDLREELMIATKKARLYLLGESYC